MPTTALRGVAFGIALLLTTTLISPDPAGAGNRRNKHNRNNGRHSHQVVERHVYHAEGPSNCAPRVGAFLGGIVVGAIIGHQVDRCPPRPRRVWIYDCEPCGYHEQNYDSWVNHLTVVHEVPLCAISVGYPPNYGGHWQVW